MQYFGVPKCPYCKKRVNFIRTWSLKRQGEYQCPRCGGISNIYLSPLVYVFALVAVFAGVAIYFFHKFILDDITLTTGIQVKCPKCHGAGVVTADDDNAYFRCLSCGHRMTQDRTVYHYDVHNQCKNCGRYYRVDIEDGARQHFPVLHVACPYCGATMPGEVHKTAEAFSYGAEIQGGKEPWFGLELWFLTSFQGKPVWALNREHLAYLIDYLSADLREKPSGSQKKTQADHLPTFMKTAKNRERIVKLLKKLQEK